jgi:RNA polymerase sigma-70 factor (ECF subfamily)
VNELADVVTEVFHREWARLVATLIGSAGDWDLAQECAQEAFTQAWRTWPRDGVPDRPGAWLLTTARRRMLDRLRRDRVGETKLAEIAALGDAAADAAPDESTDDVPDDRLRLIYTCCHPALAFEAQVALALRTLTGLTTAEIAQAFGVAEQTMGKRLVRAQSKIRDAGIPYRVPPAHLLPERTAAVLGVVYLLFNEGYVATSGPELHRPALAGEALRLAALVVELMPDDPEARGLHALLLFHQARAEARTDPAGALVPLDEQDRGRWDHTLIDQGLQQLQHARRRAQLGPFQLQAMIAACHVTAARAEDTDTAQVVALYDALLARAPSPTVELNRAVAVARHAGPEAGLAALDDLERRSGVVARGHLLPAVRADLLRRAGHLADAARAYRAAAEQATNDVERAYLERRTDELD